MVVWHTIASVRPEVGGPARSVPGLCRGLSEQGVDAHLYTADDGYAGPAGLPGGRFHAGPIVLRGCAAVRAPDLVHAHGLWQCYTHLALRAARRSNVPYVIAPRGMLEPWSLNEKRWKKRLAMWLYQGRDLKKAAALHATAESEAQQLRRLGFSQPIIVSPNGVDLPEQMPPRTHRTDGRRTALFLSRIHPKKGLIELVEAWAAVKEHAAGSATRQRGRITRADGRVSGLLAWHFEYAGPDCNGHLAEVLARIRELGVEEDFTYLGNLNDADKWGAYRRADLFVLPTYSENFGIAVAEALAAGVPVLTTTGTPWRILAERGCGWWIEPGRQALTRTLPQVLSLESGLMEEMGASGRRYVFSTLSWPAIAQGMASAYSWLLAPSRVQKPPLVNVIAEIPIRAAGVQQGRSAPL